METKKVTLTLRIPKWIVKSLWKSLPLAIILTVISYTIAIDPDEHYEKRINNYSLQEYVLAERRTTPPPFMGDSFQYRPYGHFLTINSRYPGVDSATGKNIRMPILYRVYLAGQTFLSWKGLRFFVLMWILSFCLIWIYDHYRFSIKIISDDDKEKTSRVEENSLPNSDLSK